MSLKDKEYRENLLMLMLENKDPQEFSSLLQQYISQGFDPDYDDERRIIPLSAAVVRLRLKDYKAPDAYLKVLLNHGADPNYNARFSGHKDDYDGTLLILAENKENRYGGTPLPSVLMNIRTLLKYGADPNISDSVNRNALHHAPYPELVQMFIDHGADLEQRDLSGLTPLYKNVFSDFIPSSPQLLEAFLKAGADPNAKDNEGSPLFARLCKTYGSLLDAGEDTYFYEARCSQYLNLVMMFIDYGVDIYAGNSLEYIKDPKLRHKIESKFLKLKEHDKTVKNDFAAALDEYER